jgi:hypothetical protein
MFHFKQQSIGSTPLCKQSVTQGFNTRATTACIPAYVLSICACLQRPRVLTPALSAAAQRHGFQLLALEPDADPQQWAAQGVDVIVHKVPEDHSECPAASKLQ